MGSFRLFRSKTIAPGVRINLTKSGVGLSFGNKFMRVSQHSTGSSTRSVSLPGTGFQWRDQRRHPRTQQPAATRSHRASPSATPSGATQRERTHPSLTAMFHVNADVKAPTPAMRAVHIAARNGDMWQLLKLHEQIATDSDAKDAALIAAVVLAVELHQPQVVAPLLNDNPPSPDAVPIATLATGQVAVPLMPGMAIVMAADLAVVYACVYALNRGGYYQRVTELYTSDDPQDDVAAVFAVERARALNGVRRFATAKETLAPVIRRTRFDRLIRCVALEQRAIANVGLGERAAAKRDVARLADLSPPYPTLHRLTELTG
jgi:hypothetical protein